MKQQAEEQQWSPGPLPPGSRCPPPSPPSIGYACWAAHHFLAADAPHPGAVDSRAVRVDVHDGNAAVVADGSWGQWDCLALVFDDIRGKEEELSDVLHGALVILGSLNLLLRAFRSD